MEENIPNINDSDIQRVIKREFAKDNSDAVNKILASYNSETSKGKNRVCAAILKCSNGDITKVAMYVNDANNDFRDVLSKAEYPSYSEVAFDDLSEEEEERLIRNDWTQYEVWLNKI